jgi:hypothetical protein
MGCLLQLLCCTKSRRLERTYKQTSNDRAVHGKHLKRFKGAAVLRRDSLTIAVLRRVILLLTSHPRRANIRWWFSCQYQRIFALRGCDVSKSHETGQGSLEWLAGAMLWHSELLAVKHHDKKYLCSQENMKLGW